jgi:hypothetical protein
MKWLLIFALGLLGCGDDPPPTVSSGSDRVPSGSSGGTGATGGAGGGGGEAGAGGAGGAAPKGACDNGTDLDAIEAASESIRNIARDCGLFVCAASVGNSNAYGVCVEDCVSDRVPALSTDCAGCYDNLERCGLAALCRFQCQANTCSALCLNCLNGASCITDFEQCRGLPGDSCA